VPALGSRLAQVPGLASLAQVPALGFVLAQVLGGRARERILSTLIRILGNSFATTTRGLRGA
jgi:hypothetical protein